MSQVGVRELKDRLSAHLERVQGREGIVVTERGRTVARIVPVKTSSRRPVVRGRTVADTVMEDRR